MTKNRTDKLIQELRDRAADSRIRPLRPLPTLP
jgi:hypothetical protein